MPLGKGCLTHLLRQAAQEGRTGHRQDVLRAEVDQASCQAPVHPHRQVLSVQKQFNCVWLVVVEDGIAEHGGSRRVSDIEAHPNSPMEELNCKVIRVSVVEKNSCALPSLHDQGEVEWS